MRKERSEGTPFKHIPRERGDDYRMIITIGRNKYIRGADLLVVFHGKQKDIAGKRRKGNIGAFRNIL
jgi:hypothetical protein